MPAGCILKTCWHPLLAIAVTTLLAACGFQLRGAPPVSPALEPLAVDCRPQVPGTLCEAVTAQLTLGDVSLVTVDRADFILRLQNFTRDRRATAITASAGAAEYRLRHSVEMEVISAEQVPLVATTRLNSSESYRYDDTNVLAKQREEEALAQQLDQRLAQQILFRLAPLTPARIDDIRMLQEPRQGAEAEDSGQP